MKVHRYESSEEEVRNDQGPVIFLAGPTVRGNQQHLTSWRFACIEEFKKQEFDGSLIIPEFLEKSESDKRKDWIVLWEFNGLKRADCIMFWVPRTRELIGLTTNFELGYWLGRMPDKLVYGRPEDAYRISYSDIMWKEDFKMRNLDTPPICSTMENIVKASITKATRTEDSKNIPMKKEETYKIIMNNDDVFVGQYELSTQDGISHCFVVDGNYKYLDKIDIKTIKKTKVSVQLKEQ